MDNPPPTADPSVVPASPSRLSMAQELGLVSVVALLALILSFYGWHTAAPGRPNTLLNFGNLLEGVATPMSSYAIMAVGMTVVIITGASTFRSARRWPFRPWARRHGLIGENGAGKSTLGKALAGVHWVDSGTLSIDGQLHVFHSRARRWRRGWRWSIRNSRFART